MRAHFEGPQRRPGYTIEEAMVWAMRETQRRIANRAREIAAVKTGTYRRSITADDPVVTATGVEGAVGAGGAGAPYAKAHEFGTGVYSEAPDSSHRPIVIVQVRRKALAWPQSSLGPPGGPNLRLSGGLRTQVRRALLAGKLKPADVFVFARRVVQQGQHPHPTLRRAFEESTQWIGSVLDEAVAKIQ